MIKTTVKWSKLVFCTYLSHFSIILDVFFSGQPIRSSTLSSRVRVWVSFPTPRGWPVPLPTFYHPCHRCEGPWSRPWDAADSFPLSCPLWPCQQCPYVTKHVTYLRLRTCLLFAFWWAICFISTVRIRVVVTACIQFLPKVFFRCLFGCLRFWHRLRVRVVGIRFICRGALTSVITELIFDNGTIIFSWWVRPIQLACILECTIFATSISFRFRLIHNVHIFIVVWASCSRDFYWNEFRL